LFVTCPGCRTRYRVDAAALARPGGRTVRCAACGLSWHHAPFAAVAPTAFEGGLRPPAAIDASPPLAPLREPPVEPLLEPLLESAIAAPSRTKPVPQTGSARGGGFWLKLGLPLFVLAVVLAVFAALYLSR
jgi:predicted Zn finger-like uncharacterized protein